MAKLVTKMACLLAILWLAVGNLKAADRVEWDGASISSSVAVTGKQLVFTGKGLVDAIVLSTAAAANYALFYDAASVADASTAFLTLFFSASTENKLILEKPIAIRNGLVVNPSSCVSGIPCAVALFRAVP